MTIGANYESKTTKHEGLDVVIQLWDTAGQERFESLGYAFYRGSNCCMLVYDVSNRASFEALNKWKLNFISNASPSDAANFPFMVVGNKSDLAEQVVTEEEAATWCQANGGMVHFQTSAVNGSNVVQAFDKLGIEGAKQSMGDDSDMSMPTSLSGAAGAMKLDPKDDRDRTEKQAKKKKKCKC